MTLDTVFTDELRSIYFSKERLQEIIPKIKRLKKLLGEEAKTIPELALRYILSFDEISTVIPGTRKVKNAVSNASVSDGRKLSYDLMQELKNHRWERNFYVDKDPSMTNVDFVEP